MFSKRKVKLTPAEIIRSSWTAGGQISGSVSFSTVIMNIHYFSWIFHFISWIFHFISWIFHFISWIFHFISLIFHFISWIVHFILWSFHFISWKFHFISRKFHFISWILHFILWIISIFNAYSILFHEYKIKFTNIPFYFSKNIHCIFHNYSFMVWSTEAEIQHPLKRSSRFQRLFPNPSWLVWGRASRYQKLAPTFPGIDSCLMVTKRDFLEMEASLWLNGKSRNVAKGWLST